MGRGWWEEWPWIRSIPPSISRWAKRTWSPSTPYPQLDPQWMDTTTMSPHCRAALALVMTASAAAGDRLGSKYTPGLVAVAAQSGGIPLEAVPQEKISARRPPDTGTAAGCLAAAAS